MLADRVKETSTTTGTGTLDLLGAVANFVTFVAGIGNANTCCYAIVHQTLSEWEVGTGVVTDLATDTLSRATILASSNSNAAVNFSAGTKDVFVTIPANRAEMGIGNLAPTNNVTVPANGSMQVNRKLTIASGKKIILQSGSILRIL